MNTIPFTNDSQSYIDRVQLKLRQYPIPKRSLFVDIKNSSTPSPKEISELLTMAAKYNLSFYRFLDRNTPNKKAVHNLGVLLGLKDLDRNICADEDKLTSIQVKQLKGEHNYIPYSTRKLSWHTDGYYNEPEHQINGMLLHCAQPAVEGGENLLMDIDIAFILLYNENPDYVTALMQPDAMTIPANILNGKIIREEQTGPVFSFLKQENSQHTHLHMRYSARTRHIKWKDNKDTSNAVHFFQDLWKKGSPYILNHTLKAGEGLVCNNVLHCRTEFRDSPDKEKKRVLYRGRYYNCLSWEL